VSNVITLRPKASVADALRNIADEFDSGERDGQEVTLIIGLEVFHIGCSDDKEAAANAIFNMTLGIQKLMRPVVDASLDL
jgi:hypothetical protein